MTSFTKQRDIIFHPLHQDENQALTASQMLHDIEGISLAEVMTPTHLVIHYDIRFFMLADIEDLLATVGFHLDNSLLVKIKRALYSYTEENERNNLDCALGQSNCTREVFINRYKQLPHGCRDKRSQYWRHYL